METGHFDDLTRSMARLRFPPLNAAAARRDRVLGRGRASWLGRAGRGEGEEQQGEDQAAEVPGGAQRAGATTVGGEAEEEESSQESRRIRNRPCRRGASTATSVRCARTGPARPTRISTGCAARGAGPPAATASKGSASRCRIPRVPTGRVQPGASAAPASGCAPPIPIRWAVGCGRAWTRRRCAAPARSAAATAASTSKPAVRRTARSAASAVRSASMGPGSARRRSRAPMDRAWPWTSAAQRSGRAPMARAWLRISAVPTSDAVRTVRAVRLDQCCNGEKRAPTARASLRDACCPEPPVCPPCHELSCRDGNWRCDLITCCFDCPENWVVCPKMAPIGSALGCCPQGWWVDSGGHGYCLGHGYCDDPRCTPPTP